VNAASLWIGLVLCLPGMGALATAQEVTSDALEAPAAVAANTVAADTEAADTEVADTEVADTELDNQLAVGLPSSFEVVIPSSAVPIGWFDVVVRGDFSEDADLRLDPLPADTMVGTATFHSRLGPDELRLPVASWRAGELILDGLTVVDGHTTTALEALTVTIAEQAPRGTVAKVSALLDPLALPLPPANLTLLLTGMLLALALIWIWVVRSSRVVIIPVYIPPADHVAIEALERLRLSLPKSAEEVRVFILSVSDVLRSYIEGRFAVHAPARTTEEFLLEAAAADGGLAERAEGLEGFLTQCDLVKYARHHPDAQDAVTMLDSAGTFVEETR
jgi:hypothetical protein